MGHLTTRSVALMKEYIHQPKPMMAVQITDENASEVARLVNGKLYLPGKQSECVRIYFHCCNGRQRAEWGDWVLRDSKGFHMMTNEEFASTYEEKK